MSLSPIFFLLMQLSVKVCDIDRITFPPLEKSCIRHCDAVGNVPISLLFNMTVLNFSCLRDSVNFNSLILISVMF